MTEFDRRAIICYRLMLSYSLYRILNAGT